MSEATVEADEEASSETSRLAALQAYLAGTKVPDAGRVLAIAQATLAGEAPPDDERPQALADYELFEELGRGGEGVVYRARQLSLDREVALKVTHPSGEESRTRARIEAEAAAQLDHPGIVPIYEVIEDERCVAIAMRRLKGPRGAGGKRLGPSLAELLRAADPASAIAPRDAARWIAAVARAVDYAHRKGVIHRDIKPQNILLTADGEPVITDFGLAKRLDRAVTLTAPGDVLGTPGYLAPEQARGSRVGPPADIFGLGATLYALLCGQAPFRGATMVDALMASLFYEPVPPSLRNPAVSPELDAICMKCLAKSPLGRYPSAAALADDLEAMLEDRPISASTQLVARWARWALRESHHVEVLEAYAPVNIVRAVLIFALFAGTHALVRAGASSLWTFAALWVPGVIATVVLSEWARRGVGPRSTLELQLARVWVLFGALSLAAGAVVLIKGAPPLTAVPFVLMLSALASGTTAILIGGTYWPLCLLCVVSAWLVPLLPRDGLLVAGALISVGVLLPALRHYRHLPERAADEPAA